MSQTVAITKIARPSLFSSLQTYQIWLDRWTPHATSRWIFTIALVAGFLLRIVLKQVIEFNVFILSFFLAVKMWQKALDDSTPFVKARWAGFVVLTLAYMGRILLVQV